MKKFMAMLLLPVIAGAEPGPATRYLVNEPASLLDIGMIRLETLTSDFEERVGLHYIANGKDWRLFRPDIQSQYSRRDDRIYVFFRIADSEATDAQMTEGCEEALAQMNIWLLKSLPGLFLHDGLDDPKLPPDFHASLRNMFELRCYIHAVRDSSEGRFWSYRALGGGNRDMTIGKWKMRD